MMPNFKEIITTTHDLLMGKSSPLNLAHYYPSDLARIEIYPFFIRTHIYKYLDQNFPLLKNTIDPKIWEKIKKEYFKENPAKDWRLYRCAQNFTDWIQNRVIHSIDGLTEFHYEVALFEWTEILVYHQEIDIINQGPSLAMNPTLEILKTNFPIAQYAKIYRTKHLSKNDQLWLSQKQYVSQSEKAEIVMIYRHPIHHCSHFLKADEKHLLIFKMVNDHLSMEQVLADTSMKQEKLELLIEESKKLGFII